MARRGILAELNRAIQRSARDAERAQRQRERAESAAQRTEDQRARQEERLRQQTSRASVAERKRLEREAAVAHLEARLAEVEDLNAQLEEFYTAIDGLLADTLSVDDHIDLETLKQEVEHPPFDRTDLERPLPRPVPLHPPAKPSMIRPPEPTGLRAFFGKKEHARRLLEAERQYEAEVAGWQERLGSLEAEHKAALEAHARDEQRRIEELEAEKARYERECEAREAQIAEQNAAVEKLAVDLSYGVVEAVEEYVSIVMSNSVYPDQFPVNTQFQFDPDHAELRARALIPGPDEVPSIKAYKYTKATDEITASQLPNKACKDRYASAVHQVAIRTLHEVFEADRRGLIQSIALEVGTETTHPATGVVTYVPFVAVAASRNAFAEFDLSAVIPLATLGHLGAAVSKNPYELVPIDPMGVRKA